MTTGPAAWHILTGEYPPQPGGISDYAALVAAGLAGGGGAVHVWAPPAAGPAAVAPGVSVHREAGSWSPADLARLGAALDRSPAPRRLLVQYAPNAFGRRGMNLGFCRWLVGRRRRGDEVRVMFHEVRYTMEPGDRPIRLLLPPVHLWMARTLLRAATRAYVSTPLWAEMLRPLAPRGAPPIAWTPIPSTVPAVDDPSGVAEVRGRYAPAVGALIGTFGTFRDTSRPLIAAIFPRLLVGRPGRAGLLIGRNGPAFAERLIADHPGLAGRLWATGGLPAEDVSRHLQACDLLIQADTGGLCSKQTTTMAGLRNGRAIVAGAGRMTEPVWAEERCVALAASPDPEAMAGLAESCLADPAGRARLGEAARSAYGRHFSVARTVEALDGAPGGAP